MDKRKAEVLRRLNCPPYKKHKNNVPEAMSDTCQWFIEHKTFQEWIRMPEVKLLWVSANPGCGKSVLAQYLVDHVLENNSSPTRIIYFFFKDGCEDQKTAEGALRCLLHQVLEKGSYLFTDTILKSLEELGEARISNSHDLWDILISVLSHHEAGQTICVLDALDECETAGWQRMTQALYNFRHDNMSGLKFVFLSRPYEKIGTGIKKIGEQLPTIHLSGEDEVNNISAEINKVIKERVEGLNISKRIQRSIYKKLIKAQNRTYLWVHLICEMLTELCKTGKLEGRLEGFLNQLPRTVQEAYNEVLRHSSNVEKAETMLHVIVAAARPLTLEEMATAMAVENKDFSPGRLEVRSTKLFEEQMKNICGLFVVVVDKQVYLIHQTAREFLIQKDRTDIQVSSDSRSERNWKSSLPLHKSHEVLARICVRYLLYAEGRKFGVQDTHKRNLYMQHILPADYSGPPEAAASAASVDLSQGGLTQYAKLFPLFDYSAKYWTTRYRSSDSRRSSGLDRELMRLCDTTRRGCLVWYWYRRHNLSQVDGTDHSLSESVFPTRNIYPRLEPLAIFHGSSRLLLASYLGIRRVVEILLQNTDRDINATGCYTSIPALSWAAASGHYDVVGLLLKQTKSQHALFGNTHEVDVGLCDEYGQTALMFASMNGNERVVRALLAIRMAKANINRQDKFGRTALSHAAERGQGHVVDLLLSYGAEGETKFPLKDSEAARRFKLGTTGRQPLSYAAGEGHFTVVKLLYESKVAVDLRSWGGRTALAYAAAGGHVTIFKFLLGTDEVDIDQEDDNNRTPLLHAIINDRPAIVKILHEKRVRLGLTRSKVYSGSPLYEALEHESVEVFHYFLNTEKFKVSSKHRWEQVEKAEENKETMFSEKISLIDRAVERGKLGIVEVLLTEGADITLVSRRRRYLFLWHAMAVRNVRIVELLLDRGRIDLDLTEEEYKQLSDATLWNQEPKARDKESHERIKELLDEYFHKIPIAKKPEKQQRRRSSVAPRPRTAIRRNNRESKPTSFYFELDDILQDGSFGRVSPH